MQPSTTATQGRRRHFEQPIPAQSYFLVEYKMLSTLVPWQRCLAEGQVLTGYKEDDHLPADHWGMNDVNKSIRRQPWT